MAPEMGGDLLPPFPLSVLHLEAPGHLGTQKILGSDNQTSMLPREMGGSPSFPLS